MAMNKLPLTAPSFDERELALVQECLSSGWVTQGPLTERFEKQIAELHAVEYSLATTSCTAALHLAMLALGVGEGDEVIVPAFTWITSANCGEYVGADIVFVDVDENTYNIDVTKLEASITSRTRVIVAVHLFGLAADIDAIKEVIGGRDIKIVEDAACAIGTTLHGRPVGGLGDCGCFSFHPRKVITTGEGGMVTTNSESIAQAVGSYRNHGATGISGQAEEDIGPWTMATFNNLGFNLRLSDIQAAVGLAQIEKLDVISKHRRMIAEQYNERFDNISELMPPTTGDTKGHSYQSYVVRLNDGGRERRNHIMRSLESAGIQTRPGTHAVHQLGYYRDKYKHERNDFPAAAKCEDTTITLPIFPAMGESDTDRVAEALKIAL